MCDENKLSSTARTSYITCPYFVAHGKTEIMCEGIIDGCRSSLKFEKAEGKEFHLRTYCECQYKRCEQYLSITHFKWPE